MPIVRNVTGGAQVVASAKIARRFTLVVNPGASSVFSDAQLQVNTLPNCMWYAILTTPGIIGATITPQFAVDNASVPGNVIPFYLDVMQPNLLTSGTPFFTTQRIIANMITGIITVPGGAVGPATVELILASSI